MSRSQFYTAMFFLLPLFYYLSLPIAVGDLAVWIAHGTYILENSKILNHDIFSVLKTTELIYPVLICFIYGLIDVVGGLELVSLFHKFVLLIILLLIYKNSLQKQSYDFKNFCLILISFFGFAIYFIDRPAMIALLPLLLGYLIIENTEKFEYKEVLQLLGLMLIWVNIHGSWPLLLAMLGWKFLFITKRENLFKHTLIVTVLSLATLANPFGYKIWPYLFETARISKLRNIDEWNITNLYDYFPQGIIFYVTCLILIVLFYKKFKKFPDSSFLSSPAILLLLMGFVAMRNVGLISLVLLPFLCKYKLLSQSTVLESNRKNYFNLAIVGLMILFCISQIPIFKVQLSEYLPYNKAHVYDTSAPVELVKYIKNSNSNGAILNDWDYGSYLIYSLKNRILIDTRNIIYSQEDYIKFNLILQGDNPNWREAISEYNFGFMLLDKKLRSKFCQELEASSDWLKVLENQETVLFQRK